MEAYSPLILSVSSLCQRLRRQLCQLYTVLPVHGISEKKTDSLLWTQRNWLLFSTNKMPHSVLLLGHSDLVQFGVSLSTAFTTLRIQKVEEDNLLPRFITQSSHSIEIGAGEHSGPAIPICLILPSRWIQRCNTAPGVNNIMSRQVVYTV